MAKKEQSLPHYGIKNGWTRKDGTRICIKPEVKGADGLVMQKQESRVFDSISKAKRFMRIGD